MVARRVKHILSQVHAAGVAGASGYNRVVEHARFEAGCFSYDDGHQSAYWPIPADGRLIVVGAGKAAASLARGLEFVLGERIDGGCIVVKYGHREELRRVSVIEAAHPIPDQAGIAGTEQLLAALAGLRAQDRVIVALTGGASALLVSPVEPLQLADKALVSQVLIGSGASIEEINTVRRHLSRVKGGGLLEAIDPASSLTLAISDVPTRDPAIIGSGPTVPPGATDDPWAIIERYDLAEALPPPVVQALRSTRRRRQLPLVGEHQHLIVADSGSALAAASERARSLGFDVAVVDDDLRGDTHQAARAFADQVILRRGEATVLLAAGETTLQVRGRGIGGRNQEFALVSAMALAGVSDAAVLASGTDGTDGPTTAAGAYADGYSTERALAIGMNPAGMLMANDSNAFFTALGDLHVTGPPARTSWTSSSGWRSPTRRRSVDELRGRVGTGPVSQVARLTHRHRRSESWMPREGTIQRPISDTYEG